jgi:uncharacterized BrkB/YihY/UPF0761 family membrane protein
VRGPKSWRRLRSRPFWERPLLQLFPLFGGLWGAVFAVVFVIVVLVPQVHASSADTGFHLETATSLVLLITLLGILIWVTVGAVLGAIAGLVTLAGRTRVSRIVTEVLAVLVIAIGSGFLGSYLGTVVGFQDPDVTALGALVASGVLAGLVVVRKRTAERHTVRRR